jgi:cell wall-associated NlpC family hydrolase
MGRAFVATVIPVGMVSAAAHPAFADPVPPATAPDAPEVADAAPASGAVPLPSQPLQFPTQATAAGLPTDAVGTLAAEIVSISDATQRLGEQAKAVQEELDAAVAKSAAAREAWQRADAVLAATRARVEATQAPTDPTGTASSPAQTATTTQTGPDAAATTASTAATTGSADGSVDGVKTPSPDPTATAAAREEALSNRAEATRTERAARQVLDAATDVEHEVAGRYAVVMEQFNRYRAALETLNTRNANQLEGARAARDAYESSLAASRGASTNTAGMQASPDALAAVAFALSQLGKPYAWAEEGPNSYDCSGLVYAAYLSVGVKLPRVANNQYGAGQPVLASQLLPGDLIFFSTNPSDWRQIHHVAMYIGNGKVVQAPTFGDVVKISPVWWTEYFGATRIIPAIAPVVAEPTPEPSASPTGTPTPAPTGTPSAEPTGTPTPAPAPTTTAPAATTPPVTPTGTPSPAPNPSPTPSASSAPAATTPSPSASAATPTPTTTTPATSPDPAVSPTSTPSQQGRRRQRR